MRLKVKGYNYLCTLEEFCINGIDANYDDFGVHKDISPETAGTYHCGNMKFTPKLPTQKVLDKYQITLEEYSTIANKLEDMLSFGSCGWCS